MTKANFLRLSLAVVLGGAALATHAAGEGAASTPSPAYQQECAACHIAYPPGMMPSASWQRLMGNLTKHFGTDASLDSPVASGISVWLKANAGSYRRVSDEPPQDRITKTSWFLRKHREGEVPADVWKRASVGSPSNCAACHTQAGKGDFNEHDVRIPK